MRLGDVYMYGNGMVKRRTSENHSIHSYVVDRAGNWCWCGIDTVVETVVEVNNVA